MHRLIKITSIMLGVLVLIYIATVVSLNTFLKPDNFKTKILGLIQEKIHRPVDISEGMHWSLFPQIALKLDGVKIGNTEDFGNSEFIEASQVRLNVHLLPLLTGKIEIKNISIDGLTLNLIKNTAGKTNWTISSNSNNDKISIPTQNDKPATTINKNLALIIGSFDITNSQITWNNQQTKQQLTLKNLNIHSKDINFNNKFPLQASFTLANNKNQKNINFDLKTQLSVNPEKGSYMLNDLSSNLDQTHIKGSADFTQKNLSELNFNVIIDKLNIDNYSNILGDNTKSKTNKNTSSFSQTTSEKKSEPTNSLSALRDLNINGKINIGQLTINHLNLQNITITISNKQGLLKLAPVNAELYQGNFKSNLTIDARSNTPIYAINSSLNNIQIGELLKDLTGKSVITGTTNLNVDFTTQGLEKKSFMQNLNGNAKFAINNGIIKGMDIFGLIRQAVAFINNGKGNINLSDVTVFTSLTATAIINNGLVKNNDLLLKSDNLSASGSGNANLVTEQIKYRLTAIGKVDDKNNVDIPIDISGSFNNPHAAIDFSALAKKAVVKQLGKQIEKQIGVPVQNILKGFNLDL